MNSTKTKLKESSRFSKNFKRNFLNFQDTKYLVPMLKIVIHVRKTFYIEPSFRNVYLLC